MTKNNSVFITAELSANHGGEMEKETIRAAKLTGADTITLNSNKYN
jgi:sialic acid synthase SpsE